LLVALLPALTPLALAQERSPRSVPLEGRVTRVIDGDTIDVESVGTVRLLGVDAPEMHGANDVAERFARESADYVRRRLLGQTVRLELDWQKLDRYGRTLAYVQLDDGSLFNADLIRDGYAVAYVQQPYRRMDEFIGLEREARLAGRGLWATDRATSAAPGAEALRGTAVPDAAAAQHVGEHVTVEGTVVAVYTSRSGNTFLNFGAPYPRQTFSAVVFRPRASAFDNLHRLEGRRVRVTGRLKLYHGKPEIILEEPSQLEVPEARR
jgi:micrococcal nuclease